MIKYVFLFLGISSFIYVFLSDKDWQKAINAILCAWNLTYFVYLMAVGID